MINISKFLVITGGVSNEKELSLISGADVSIALLDEKIEFDVLEVTPDKKMKLYNSPQDFLNRKTDSAINYKLFQQVEFTSIKELGYNLAFLALDGKFGEDGQIQAMLDFAEMTYTGSGVLASSIGMNKSKTYEVVSRVGVSVPKYILAKKHNYSIDLLDSEISKNIFYPCVVKPNDSGSSIGVGSATNKAELATCVKEAFTHSSTIIIQQFIRGNEFACGVLGNTDLSEITVLPVAESHLKNFEVFTHYQKYFSNDITETCPAEIDEELSREIMQTSKLIHQTLGCDGLSRCDFRFDLATKKLYLLEINTSPGHTKNSICPQEGRAIGLTFGQFIKTQLELALDKKDKTSLV